MDFPEGRMNSKRRLPPIWLIGLSNATLGFSNGITLFVMPQLMATVHVPEPKIATITAISSSAGFWFVFFGPILDVRFSRRWYATLLAALSGIAAATSFLSVHHLAVLQIAMVVCTASAILSSTALGGWLSNITPHEQKNPLSKWMNIALISGMGVIVAAAGEIVSGLPANSAALLIGTIVFLPTTIFLFMPAPGPDGRLASESFQQFNREVLSLLRRREVVIVLLLFLSPCSTFVLPNLLGGLGADFHASPRTVSLSGGAGAFVPGLIGCFLFPLIARYLRLRSFYFANGILGCLFTLSLVILPHTSFTFALAVFGEFLFQAIAFSIQIGIVFEAIGPDNPLAATTFAFLTAATNVPVTYLTVIDGHAYSIAGITGTLFADAAIGIGACTAAAILLARFGSARASMTPVIQPETAREEI
jgi:MFS transporter, PAT family, beta-lactamase induction signal transducer AmpG